MRKQSQVNGIDQIFNKIIGEKFPKLEKDLLQQTEEERTLSRQGQKKGPLTILYLRQYLHRTKRTKRKREGKSHMKENQGFSMKSLRVREPKAMLSKI